MWAFRTWEEILGFGGVFVVILQVIIFNRNTFLKGSHLSFRFGKELVLLSDLTIT